MKLTQLKLKNFRGYYGEVVIDFCDLTAFVGKNDVGKPTILEALDIFFNEDKAIAKIEKNDINKQAQLSGDTEVCISACFEELPINIIIDATYETTMQSEYLLNSGGQLEIIKKFPNASKPKAFIKANHPTNPACSDLLSKTNTNLKKIIDDNGIQCADKTKNPVMRSSIWEHYSDDLQLQEVELDITKGDTKSISDKLLGLLPLYSLFQSYRKNSDGDSEVQDPLKEAVKQILNDEELTKKLA